MTRGGREKIGILLAAVGWLAASPGISVASSRFVAGGYCAVPLKVKNAVRAAASGPRATVRRAAQVQYDSQANVAFERAATEDGGLLMVADAGEIRFRKTVYPDGRATLQLESGDEVVVFDISPGSIGVTRGERSVRFAPAAISENDLAATRDLLDQSTAVRRFRALAASYEASASDTSAGIAVLMSDALVGMLDGDVGAPRRVARRLAQKEQQRVRRVLFNQCYRDYEREIWYAFTDYESCLESFNPWNPLRAACSARYIVWAESAWFSFLACSAFPWP